MLVGWELPPYQLQPFCGWPAGRVVAVMDGQNPQAVCNDLDWVGQSGCCLFEAGYRL
jgi:hypothetical protein